MDRHVIANMGAEMGATTTVFPSDAVVAHFMKTQRREEIRESVGALTFTVLFAPSRLCAFALKRETWTAE